MSCWTKETEGIIKAHRGDFNSTNWQKVLSSYGGYEAYLKALGGVFAKYAGKDANVKTAVQLQEIAQYVFGLMAIYGFNYNNDSTQVRWGGGYPFYKSALDGRCNWGRIDDLCSSPDLAKTTNCNFGIDALLYKAGVFPRVFDYSYRYKAHARQFKVIRKKADLRIGDLVHMFHSPVKSDNPDTWEGWGHVAIVGERKNGKIILYDSGNRFVRTGNFKIEFDVNGQNAPIGDYDNYDGWAGIHIVDLAGDYGEVKGDSELAVEVIAGKFGSGVTRMKMLGNRYGNVQSRVNYFLGGTKAGRAAYLRAAASYVLKGFAGTDEERKKFFGANYKDVQEKVNWVLQTAKDVIADKYGKGEDRKKALGDDYNLIQQQVNRMV